jgi:hypothetical protein
VRSVAEGWVFAVLAVAEPHFLGLREGELLGSQAGAFVGAVTHGLVTAETTCTPPMVSSFKFHGVGLGVENLGQGFHGGQTSLKTKNRIL